jgi:hypothetical protein
MFKINVSKEPDDQEGEHRLRGQAREFGMQVELHSWQPIMDKGG